MNMGRAFLSAVFLCVSSAGAWPQDHLHDGNSAPYTGLQKRQIKSLSDKDIAEIRSGAGWGLALPAELSGRPGPAHLLELQDELGLSAKQIAHIKVNYEEMRAEAITAGERFIAAEAALSGALEGNNLDNKRLRALLEASAQARADLRFIHLSRHLSTPQSLTIEQIQKYNVLRGYADNPCVDVPDGHAAEMWRRHNGCNKLQLPVKSP